jgi:hypothetical protein
MAALLGAGKGHASTWALTIAASSGSISESVVKARSRRARNSSFPKGRPPGVACCKGRRRGGAFTVRCSALRRRPCYSLRQTRNTLAPTSAFSLSYPHVIKDIRGPFGRYRPRRFRMPQRSPRRRTRSQPSLRAASIMARMPARSADGRFGQASMMR